MALQEEGQAASQVGLGPNGGGSVVYTRQQRAAGDKRGQKRKVSPACASGKGKPKARSAKFEAPAGQLDKKIMDGSRDKLFLDDLVAAVTSPLQELAEHQVNTDAVMNCIKQGLRFCFETTLFINGKHLHAWSLVRKELRTEIVKAHMQAACDC